jgi:hypothetical protein
MQTNNRQETEARIRELRQSIDELEQQLSNTIDADEATQHKTLEHLDEYMNAVDTKVSSLKLFWQTLKEEWSSR